MIVMRRQSLVLLVFSTVCAAAACVVGDPEPRDLGSGSDDSPDAGEDPDPSPDAPPQQVACEEPALTVPNGNHNAGLDCLTCHDGNTLGAPTWTIAGTLYDSAAGTNPVSAATILVTDANGVELKLITADNGNFYTSEPVTFPLTVGASKCPDTKFMTGTPQVGACNSCHTGGAIGRIHLP